jgi:hypothetical protein
MSIERRPCQKWNFSIFSENNFFKKIWTYRWICLKKCYYWWKFCWIISRGCPETATFRSKKGYFQQLISRLRKLTLTPDLHQWKIWTFYLPCIPSLGGWQTNGLPTNRSWSQPTFVFSKSLKYIMNGGIFSSILGIIEFAVLYRF